MVVIKQIAMTWIRQPFYNLFYFSQHTDCLQQVVDYDTGYI
jgi:hypothetical protein